MPRITSVKQRQLVAASPDNTKEQFLSRRVFNIGTGFSGGIERITLQTDGKFLVGGGITLFNGGSIGSRFTRLNADGTLDTAFNANLGTGFNNTVRAISVQSDGKILVGGDFSTFNGNARLRLMRFNTDGTEDTAFYTNLGTAFNNSVYSATLQPDGGIIVVGLFTTLNGNTRNRLVRLNANGTEDTAFYANLGTGFGGSSRTISVQSDGKIVVGGFFTTLNGVTRNRLVRFNSDGTEDTAFYTNLGTAFNDIVDSTVLQPDGKILAVGQFTQFNGTTRNYLVRLNSDGTEDTEFNNNLGAGFSTPTRAISVQSDGKILVGGIFTVLNNVLFGVIRNRLVRLNADGTEDTAFYTNLGTAFNNTVNSIALQSDGKILVGGLFTQLNGVTYGGFVRLDSRGIADIASIPAATYAVTPAANNINEGSALTFTAATANISDGTVLGWRVIDRPEDFAVSTGTVTINSNSGTFAVTAAADVTTEGAETFRAEISKLTGTTLATSSAVTINDTSTPPPVYNVTPAASAVDEGSSLVFTVTTENVSDGTTLYWTVSQAAEFDVTSGSFTITSNSGTFSVKPAADLVEDGAVTFTASVRTGSVSGTVVATSSNITINDTSKTVTLLRTHQAPDEAASANFGGVVAMNDQYYVISAPQLTVGGVNRLGRAYQYDLATGSLVRVLDTESTTAFAQFGSSICMNSTHVFIGHQVQGVIEPIYGFNLDTGAVDYTFGPEYNGALSCNEDFLVVGYSYTPSPSQAGTVTVYDLSDGSVAWTADNPNLDSGGSGASGDLFGWSVDIDRFNNVAVGAVGADISVSGAAGYVYVYDDSGSLQATVSPPVQAGVNRASDEFGTRVKLRNLESGSVLMVSAPFSENGVTSGVGYVSAYSYVGATTVSNNRWIERPAANQITNDLYGVGVAANNRFIAIARRGPTDATQTVEIRDILTGDFVTSVVNPNSNNSSAGSDALGAQQLRHDPMAMTDTHLIVGAAGEASTPGGVEDAGVAYVFKLID